MELNSINKTGTWSEAADRLNNNFSKTSTELEKVKQNGIRNKGLFSTLKLLEEAVPSPVVGDWAVVGDRKSTRLNSSHTTVSRMPSSA